MAPFYTTTTSTQAPTAPCSLANTYLLFLFLEIANLTGVRWHLMTGLVCVSLMISDAEHVFTCLLAVSLSPLLPPSFTHVPVEICWGPDPYVSKHLPSIPHPPSHPRPIPQADPLLLQDPGSPASWTAAPPAQTRWEPPPSLCIPEEFQKHSLLCSWARRVPRAAPVLSVLLRSPTLSLGALSPIPPSSPPNLAEKQVVIFPLFLFLVNLEQGHIRTPFSFFCFKDFVANNHRQSDKGLKTATNQGSTDILRVAVPRLYPSLISEAGSGAGPFHLLS